MEKGVDERRRKGSKKESFPRVLFIAGTRTYTCVDESSQVIPGVIRELCTLFPQLLHIESLPYFSYLFTNCEVELDGFFDLFNRMDGCRMIFASKFCGDLWKAEM